MGRLNKNKIRSSPQELFDFLSAELKKLLVVKRTHEDEIHNEKVATLIIKLGNILLEE